MNNRVLLGAAATLVLALSAGAARAQLAVGAPSNWYLGGEGGWTSLESPQTGTSTSALGHSGFSQTFSDGFNAGARGGLEWGPWRLEEEFRFQENGINGFSLGGVHMPAHGNRDAYALMTNLIYDFTFGSPISPHIGAGIGAVDLNDSWSGPGGRFADSNSWQFGYQAIAGIRYDVNPSVALDLDYRYLATTDPTFHFSGPGAVAAGVAGGNYTSGYATHSIVASVSFKFGAPPPPPPPPVVAPAAAPAPPPVVRKVFLVFFDWDKDTITPEGMQVIRKAADAWHAGSAVTIKVTGYTDRSGSAGYNQRLSERRAHNVAVAMARFGVPRNEMQVSGRGENDNRVPTANGVREPQNRRVEIVFP